MKNDHTGFRNGDLFCFHCGTAQQMPLPMPVKLASDFMNSFAKRHRSCPKTWQEPMNVPAAKNEAENAQWWLINGEKGISSKTMYKYLHDSRMPVGFNESHPLDPDDFRRCHLLLEAVPQFRAKLHLMKPVSPVWSNLVDNWDKLTELLEEQMRTRKANGMYELMKQLGA